MPEEPENQLENPEAPGNTEGTGDEEARSQDGDEDPTQAAIQAAIEAERERIKQETLEQLKADNEAQQKAWEAYQAEQAQMDALANSFGTTVKEIRENAKALKFYDEVGREKVLDDETIEETIVKPLQRYNTNGLKAVSLQVLQALHNVAINSLPQEAQEEFVKRAGGKPLNEWLETYSELLAPKTSWAKAEAKKYEAAIKAAEARGFNKGRQAPAGIPPQGDGTGQNRAMDLTTASGLARAKRDGLIDDNQFNEYWQKLP